MDLMLQMVERIGLHEVPEALEILQVRLGHATAQFLRTKVIYDINWHWGIRDIKDFTFYLDVLPSSSGSCRGLLEWLRLGVRPVYRIWEGFSYFSNTSLGLPYQGRSWFFLEGAGMPSIKKRGTPAYF